MFPTDELKRTAPGTTRYEIIDAYQDKRTIILPELKNRGIAIDYTAGGTYSFFFINRSYTLRNSNWRTTIATLYAPYESLYPTNSTYMSMINQELKDMIATEVVKLLIVLEDGGINISTFPKDDFIKLFVTFYSKFKAYLQSYTVGPGTHSVTFETFMHQILVLILSFVNDYEKIVLYLTMYMGVLKPDTKYIAAYGATKMIYFARSPLYATLLANRAKKIQSSTRYSNYLFSILVHSIKVMPNPNGVGIVAAGMAEKTILSGTIFDDLILNNIDLFSSGFEAELIKSAIEKLYLERKINSTFLGNISKVTSLLKYLIIQVKTKIKNPEKDDYFSINGRLFEYPTSKNRLILEKDAEMYAKSLSGEVSDIKRNQPLQMDFDIYKKPAVGIDTVYSGKFDLDAFISLSFKEDLSTIPVKRLKSRIDSIGKIENKLQIIDIAVGSGTAKPFIDATLTELVQNSVDAIRTHIAERDSELKRDLRVERYKIEINIERTDDSIIISVVDRIGMTYENLTNLFIPFLSSKTASEIVTGEMGSGFFNIYRESKNVSIITEKDKKTVYVMDTPIKKSGRVVNIEKQIVVYNSNLIPYGDGTKIQFEIIANDVEKLDIISRVYYYTSRVLAMINHPSIDLVFMGNTTKIDRTLLLKTDDLECYILYADINKFRRGPKDYLNYTSYITTKGIPFAELGEYLGGKNIISDSIVKEISTGMIINIKGGLYTPTQTRTKINISDENMEKLQKFILDSAFMYMSYKIAHNLFDSMSSVDFLIGNYTSVSYLNQLVPQIKSILPRSMHDIRTNEFYAHYKFDSRPSISETIKYMITGVSEHELKGVKKKNIDLTRGFDIAYPHKDLEGELRKKIVLGFVSSKIYGKQVQAHPKIKEKGLANLLGEVKKLNLTVTIPPDVTDLEDRKDLYIEAISAYYYRQDLLAASVDNASESKGGKGGITVGEDIERKIKIMEDKGNYAMVPLNLNGRNIKAIMEPLFQAYVDAFCSISTSKGIAIATPRVICEQLVDSSKIVAFYEPGTASIHVNLAYIGIVDVVKLVDVLSTIDITNIQALDSAKIWKTYMSLTPPDAKASTMVHELEHARQRGGHEGSAHGSVSLRIDGVSKEYPFEQAANKVLEVCIANRLYETFLAKSIIVINEKRAMIKTLVS